MPVLNVLMDFHRHLINEIAFVKINNLYFYALTLRRVLTNIKYVFDAGVKACQH